MSDYFIGVDIGTGSVKALAVADSGKILTTAQIPYPTFHPQENLSEQDPDTILKSFIRCIHSITKELARNPAGIALSSAMHSIMFVDRKGNAASNLITWADNRAAQTAEKIKRSSLGEVLYEQNGTPIHAMTPVCKLTWFKENDPSSLKDAFKILSIKEYIWSQIFHTFEADHSLASATGMMNIETLKWSENALDISGVEHSQLPSLVSTGFFRNDADPNIASQMGIDAKTPFVIGASDGCMANLGSFAVKPGIGALTIGTSGAIRVASKKPICNFEAMTFNYRLDEETFICGGPTNNGGGVLKWYSEKMLGKTLSTANDYHELLSPISSTNAGADGLIFLPYILGERAPIWNANATGSFINIRNTHKQSHFTRAVIEGISMALYNIASKMEATGLPIDRIHVSGGFVHSAEWLQILTNIFGKQICLVNSGDASALGATYLGMKKLGILRSYHDIEKKTEREFYPDKEIHNLYLDQLSRFNKLYSGIIQSTT